MPEDFAPSPTSWVRDQVAAIVAAGDTAAASIMGHHVVLLTMRGARTGRLLKVPVMRVEHDGVYAAVASKGGAPDNPQWYHNLVAHPQIEIQDGTQTRPATARLATDEERAQWWPRCVAAFPPYAEYQQNTDRQIPVFLIE